MVKDTSIKEDSFPSSYYDEETYSKGLDRESTLERQVQIIAKYYTNKDWSRFEYGVKFLIALLPYEIIDSFKPLPIDFSEDGIEKHYEQFIAIQKKLQKDTSMIYKKKFIKTYE